MAKAENEVLNAVLDWLWYNHIEAWRNNNTPVYSQRYGLYMKQPRGSKKGIADILGILPDGRFLAIEVKTPIGKVSKEQKEFLKMINNNGGVGFVARKIEDMDYLRQQLSTV